MAPYETLAERLSAAKFVCVATVATAVVENAVPRIPHGIFHGLVLTFSEDDSPLEAPLASTGTLPVVAGSVSTVEPATAGV